MSQAGADYDTRLSACPACDAVPLARSLAGGAGAAAGAGQVILSLPTAHCAVCITDVERALSAVPGVRSARVNLTLRRATVDAPGLTADDLIPVLDRIGYEAHELDPGALSSTAADRQGRDILMRIGVSGFAMMNVMILSVAVWSGAEESTRLMFHWISAAIALPTVVFAGQPFFASAWRALRAGRLGMDVPISLALILASAISVFETIQQGRHAYFDAAVMLCFFLLIGRYLDYRTRAVARSAAEELTALEVPRAIALRDGIETPVAVADLVPGDVIVIRPGARVAADGVALGGHSDIDRSLLTGESVPVAAGPGMVLSAGEVNLTGPLTMRVTAAGRDSSLARLTALVASAESARGRYTSLADRASRAYAPVVHLLALGSFAGWLWATGDARLATNIAAAVLIITCPCALGLAVPAVVTAASGRLFRRGLLIKDGTALERMADIDTVVFDKTGTLTVGQPRADQPGRSAGTARPVAAALAGASSHPLSRALAAALDGVAPAVLDRPARGARLRGRGRMAGPSRAAGPPRMGRHRRHRAGRGQWLSLGQGAPMRLDFTDALRPGAQDCVAALRRSGCRVVLLSGDQSAPVRGRRRTAGDRRLARGRDAAGKGGRDRCAVGRGRACADGR